MRDPKQLHPRLQILIERLKAECDKCCIKIGISECLRTVEEQDELYAQGRTKPGSIVTNAKGSTYSSMHQWGVAFDFYRNDGHAAFDDSDGFFTKVGNIGQSIGLEWGGNFKSIKDKPHFQLPDWGSTPSSLKAQYGTPVNFMAAWSGQGQTTTLLQLQQALNTDGFLDGNGRRLVEDGLYGKCTVQSIERVCLSTKTIHKYLNVTKWIQNRIGVTPDGLYGNGTKAGVACYQKKKGLAADGIAGPNTIKAMIEK